MINLLFIRIIFLFLFCFYFDSTVYGNSPQRQEFKKKPSNSLRKKKGKNYKVVEFIIRNECCIDPSFNLQTEEEVKYIQDNLTKGNRERIWIYKQSGKIFLGESNGNKRRVDTEIRKENDLPDKLVGHMESEIMEYIELKKDGTLDFVEYDMQTKEKKCERISKLMEKFIMINLKKITKEKLEDTHIDKHIATTKGESHQKLRINENIDYSQTQEVLTYKNLKKQQQKQKNCFVIKYLFCGLIIISISFGFILYFLCRLKMQKKTTMKRMKVKTKLSN